MRTGSGLGAPALLVVAILSYSGVNLYRLAHFYPLEFDLAIFGQGVWLLSHGETPFVTIRGLNLFGEHATWVHLPVALLYAALGSWAGVWVLVLLQSLALGLAGLMLQRSAQRELGSGLALLVLTSYLLYPALQHTWLEYYEPVNLAIPCLLAATLAVREQRDRSALIWSLLALATMENIAATVAAIGLYAVAVGRRKLGVCLLAIVAAYLLLMMRVTFPLLSEHGYVYSDRLYGDYARNGWDAIAHLARPDHLWDRLATAANGRYLLGLLVPVGFLPLAAPILLGLAVQLPLNLISSWPYAQEIRYHYVAPIIPFVFLALIRALALCPPRSWRRRLATAALVVGLAAGQYLYASPWIVPREGQRWWRGLEHDARERAEIESLLRRVPSGASISAHYRFLPALCARAEVFLFPSMGPEWPQALLVEEARPSWGTEERDAFERARRGGDYFEAGRTSTGTLLLFRGPRAAGRPAGAAASFRSDPWGTVRDQTPEPEPAGGPPIGLPPAPPP